MLKSIYAAVYTAIVLDYIKRIFDKVKAPMEHDIPLEYLDSSDNWYVFVDGFPVMWEDSKESAMVFCWNAIAKRKSLATKLKIVETAEEVSLVASEDIPGISPAEIAALNDTIDESE